MASTETTEHTFEQLARDVESGTILHDEFRGGVRFIIMRGPSSLCAYVGVPADHPLAGFDYDTIPIRAHYGLTFASEGTPDNAWPEGWYWYGWDYSHSGDMAFYSVLRPTGLERVGEKGWTLGEVIEDSWGTIYDFQSLVRLAERIAFKRGAPA